MASTKENWHEGHLELPLRASTIGIIGADTSVKETQPLSSYEETAKPPVSKAEVLEEMFKLQETLGAGVFPHKLNKRIAGWKELVHPHIQSSP